MTDLRAHLEDALRDPDAVLADHQLTGDRTAAPAVLLDEVAAFVRRYVWLPSPEALTADVLWIAHCHAIDAFDVTPYLALTSPEPRCGKSLLQEVNANSCRTLGTC